MQTWHHGEPTQLHDRPPVLHPLEYPLSPPAKNVATSAWQFGLRWLCHYEVIRTFLKGVNVAAHSPLICSKSPRVLSDVVRLAKYSHILNIPWNSWYNNAKIGYPNRTSGLPKNSDVYYGTETLLGEINVLAVFWSTNPAMFVLLSRLKLALEGARSVHA